mgnify:CR=1 FL=1
MGFFASLDWRRVLTACSALVIAIGSGHVMQDFLTADPMSTAADLPILSKPTDPLPLPKDPVESRMVGLVVPPVLMDRPYPDRQKQDLLIPETSGDPCRAALALEPQPAAMVRISAWYPCAPSQRARLIHEGLELEFVTDSEGRLRLDLPALEVEAAVTVVVDNHAVSAVARIPDAIDFERVALVWDGPQVLSMHAFEFGADRSQTGHVWSGASHRPDRAARGAGGFLVSLGDQMGGSAEIYSFPAGLSASQGIVRLLVEAEVTGDTCGRMILAKALQTGPLGIAVTDVELQMPDCAATGEIVRLQNLLQDMRLAGR